MTLVGKIAPNFTSPAVLGNGKIIENFNFQKHIKEKNAVLFFWPMDFTFVCPSELIAFDKRYEEFQKRNVEIIGVSCDSQFAHNAWRNTAINKGGIGQVRYVMVADTEKKIQTAYNIKHPNMSISLRGSFILDRHHIIRHLSINDLPIGRNIDEILRILDALSFHEKNGKACPAQWERGKEGIHTSTDGVAKYLKENLNDL